MMCYYLNVQFQGQRVKELDILTKECQLLLRIFLSERH